MTIQHKLIRAHIGTILWLFPALLLATLLQNYFDLMAIFSGEALSLYSYSGPIFLKIGKDIIYALIFIISIKYSLAKKTSILTDYSTVFFIVLFILFYLSYIFNGLFIAILGLRWVFPLILFFIMKDFVFDINEKQATFWLWFGIFICLSAQIYQLFNMPPVYGEIIGGLAARTPGIYLAPNSAAFFGCASAMCLMVFRYKNSKIKILASLASLLISLLAQSGTGIITSSLLILWVFSKDSFLRFISIALVMISISIVNLNAITMRNDYVSESGGGRITILTNIVKNSITSISNLGKYTNAANLQSDDPENQVAPDSLVASWMGNFGFLSIILAFLFWMFIRHRMNRINHLRAMPCIIVFISFSFTTIIFEAFPMNIFIAIAAWSAQKQA